VEIFMPQNLSILHNCHVAQKHGSLLNFSPPSPKDTATICYYGYLWIRYHLFHTNIAGVLFLPSHQKMRQVPPQTAQSPPLEQGVSWHVEPVALGDHKGWSPKHPPESMLS
jgi:hypothetical protein